MTLPQVTVQDLAAFIASHADQAPLLLDVREDWELQTARLDLPGATTLHIPMHSLPARHAELPPAQPVLVLCHHGVRSLQCVAWLRQQGHPAVYNIAGGIDAWSCTVDASVPRY
ncbi:MAG: rhodanese-like domain-containing protein [Aquabacterium sp.]|nr:rhodanese-like domain-containing protein [Aquabacterium sp.]